MLLWELLTLLGLLLLRIGLPLAAIGLLTWWLTRLDRKWQSQSLPAIATTADTTGSRDRQVNRPIIPVPCWVFRACPPERCAKCRVYQAYHAGGATPLPCWRIHLAQDGRLPGGCRTCAIFAVTAPQPSALGAD